MTDYIIRPLTNWDVLDAAELWENAFGDDESLVFEFYRLFDFTPGFGACAEYKGKVVAAAYCPNGMDYIDEAGNAHKGAYLYAVATAPEHQGKGLGKAICRLCRDMAWERDCKYIFTRPSEPGLYAWYEDAIGAVPAMGCQVLEFERKGADMLPFMRMTASAYEEVRNKYLAGVPHVRMDRKWLTHGANVHQGAGGGYYAVGDVILDCYQDETTAYINEILPIPTPEEAEFICQTFMTIGGAQKCVCTIYGEDNYVSVAANQCDVPKNNPYFGLCFG